MKAKQQALEAKIVKFQAGAKAMQELEKKAEAEQLLKEVEKFKEELSSIKMPIGKQLKAVNDEIKIITANIDQKFGAVLYLNKEIEGLNKHMLELQQTAAEMQHQVDQRARESLQQKLPVGALVLPQALVAQTS